MAILAVVAVHSGLSSVPGGARGVDLFFVLSGYLITGLLLTEQAATGSISPGRFWWRRFLRLAPPLIVMLATYAVLCPLLLPRFAAHLWRDIGLSAFYLMDYAPFEPRPLSHMWSLAIEEQFYLLWPLALLALGRLSRDTAMRVLIGLWLAITLARLTAFGVTRDWPAAYLPLHVHSSGLLMGALIRFVPRPPSIVSWVGALVLGLLICVGPGDWFGSLAWGIPATEFAGAALIAGMAHGLRRVFAWPPLAGLGLISYGVYLWHLPVSAVVAGPPVQNFAVTLGISAAIATASYFTVEAWARRYRLEPTKSALAQA